LDYRARLDSTGRPSKGDDDNSTSSDEEVSIGDFVVSGGELRNDIIDAVVRNYRVF